ncbi:MAG: MFS transporter [Kiritimatiellales bacterium]|nr:MFS transporter [Kiritimatiellales bacterium]
MLNDQQRKRAFNIIIATQCLGMISGALFQNGFYLNYFSKLGLSSATIAMLFALPPLLGTFLLLPFAFYSDRFGKKKLALGGQVLAIAGLLLMMAAGGFFARSALLLVVASLVVASIGGSLQGASWFALLNPIVPREIRGRFFGRLRVTFQLVGILYTMLITRALKISQAMVVFQILLAIVFMAAVVRYFTYARIPELENAQGETEHRSSFRRSFAVVLAVRGYVSFNSYVFLITLFTAAIPVIFGLMQKDVFAFTPSQITLMGMLFLVGSVIGCWVGGRLVDRRGTRFVFLVAHVAYAVIMLALLARHWMPWPLIVHVGGCSLIFSLIAGMAGVAITSEIMALIPAANKSLSTGFTMTLVNAAAALSGMCVARSISWKILSPEWAMLGRTYTAYDSLLLAFAILILLMLAAIGLVPPIMKKAQLLPGANYPRP